MTKVKAQPAPELPLAIMFGSLLAVIAAMSVVLL